MSASLADEVKHGKAIVIADDRPAVDQTGSSWQCRNRQTNEREPTREIMAVARDQPDAVGIAARHKAKPVVFDFVYPARAGRRRLSGARQAWLNLRQGSIGADAAPKLTHY